MLIKLLQSDDIIYDYSVHLDNNRFSIINIGNFQLELQQYMKDRRTQEDLGPAYKGVQWSSL